MLPFTDRERESMLSLAPGIRLSGTRPRLRSDSNDSIEGPRRVTNALRREVANKIERADTVLLPRMGALGVRSGFRKADLAQQDSFGSRGTASRGTEERWVTGKKAARALEKMLEEPPPFSDVIDAERIRELQVMCTSPDTFEWLKGRNGLILHSTTWNFSMGIVIMLNSVAIGLEQTLQHNNHDVTVFMILENFFLCIFTVELVMNIVEEGVPGLLHDRWLQMDVFLVIFGIFTGWILTPIMGSLHGLGPIIVLRTVRLLRLARMVRLLRQCRQLWTLVQGFLSSVGTMVHTSALLLMVIYVFSCVGMELITRSPAYGNNRIFTDVVDEHFTDLPRIMLTLVRFIAMDSVAAIYTPLITEKPLLGIYFFAIVLAVFVVMMNIVTAVIVNTALETNALDKEAKRAYQSQIRKSITHELARMFDFFDEDHHGTLSLKELKQAPPEAVALLCKLTERPNVEDIFVEIDLDGDGELTVEEFCQGILNIVSSEVPMEMRQMHAQMQSEFSKMFYHFERLQSNVEKGFAQILAMERKIPLNQRDVTVSEPTASHRLSKDSIHKKPRTRTSKRHPGHHPHLKTPGFYQHESATTLASTVPWDESEPTWATKLLNLLGEVKACVESAHMSSSKQLDRNDALLEQLRSQYQMPARLSVTSDTWSTRSTLDKPPLVSSVARKEVFARPPQKLETSARADYPDSEPDLSPRTPDPAQHNIEGKKKTKVIRKARKASSCSPPDVGTNCTATKSSNRDSRELEPKCVGRPAQSTRTSVVSFRFSTDDLFEESQNLVGRG